MQSLLSKANLYSEADQMISTFAGGIEHPARAVIIRDLRDLGPMNVMDLAQNHPLTLGSFSQHLEKLREVHLVNFKKKHPFFVYELDHETYQEAAKYFLDFFSLNVGK